MACAATAECADGLSCDAGACAAPKPVPVVKQPDPVKPPEVIKKPPEPKKPPPPVVHQKPADPYVDNKPKVDPQEALKSGLQQYARGDTSAALASFRSALSSNPGFSPAYRGIGLVYEKLGNKAQARVAYKKYLALAPTAGDADQIRERMERL
jgi:tetratricopeptide (TPR) repeat protein